jgi:hypothetical protein
MAKIPKSISITVRETLFNENDELFTRTFDKILLEELVFGSKTGTGG